MGSADFTNYIEKVLAYMASRNWVDVDTIGEQIDLPVDKVTLLLEFMEFSKFIELDNNGARGKISKFGELLLNIS